MIKKILLFFLIFIMFCPSASAWSQSWDSSVYDSNQNTFALTACSVVPYTYGNALRAYQATTTDHCYFTITNTLPGYLSTIVYGDGVNPKVAIQLYNATGQGKLSTATIINCNSNAWHKIEVIENGDGTGIETYLDGSLVTTVLYKATVTGSVASIKFYANTQSGTGNLYFDNFATSSDINRGTLINEGTANLSFSWTSMLMRSYVDQQTITLYSLTNPTNAGTIATWNIPQQDNTSGAEWGYFTMSRSDILGTNFGLYMLEMKRGNDEIADDYFYYDQLSDPYGFPETLFMGTSSVSTNIRDEENNGGTVEAGGSVYLYPKPNNPADYTFTYNILSLPYAISTEISTVYNTSAINSLKMDYTGLEGMSYNVSIDGVATGQTGGSDTYSHTFSGAGVQNAHIISFSPDYSAPGVWGVVTDTATQKGIKSATVSVTGTNYAKTLYTDDNGVYYLTNGITAGNTYTITVTKPGYVNPPSQSATAIEGETTRNDFFMDPTETQNGAGLYYAPHDVAFSIWEYWYSGIGLQGVTYTVYNNSSIVTTGTTDSKGMFTLANAQTGTNYTIEMQYGGHNYTEYIQPSLYEYTLVLNKEGTLHTYVNNWLTLNYTENTNNVTVQYTSNKTLSGASLVVKAENGTVVSTQTLATQNGTFLFVTGGTGGYTLNFDVVASDGSTAKMSWGLSYPSKLPLFPDSYPDWLKNTLYVGILILFLLAFGKSRSDVACGSVAVMVSMGYYFEWLICSFNLVILIWIIALGAVYLHYKRTGGVG